MLISPAYAQAGGAGAFDPISLLPFIAVFAIIYFLMIRPQQKRAKEHREMLSKIRRNDHIVTNGGIMGVVTKAVDDQEFITVEICEGVKVNVVRAMVSEVRAKTEPVPSGAKPTKGKGRGKSKAQDEEQAADDQAADDQAADDAPETANDSGDTAETKSDKS